MESIETRIMMWITHQLMYRDRPQVGTTLQQQQHHHHHFFLIKSTSSSIRSRFLFQSIFDKLRSQQHIGTQECVRVYNREREKELYQI